MTVTATTTTPPATTPSTTTPSTSATNADTAAGLDSLASNFDTFLTLLTTQLQNQDPTAPLDSSQFTQQLVQMTGVQQQLDTNNLLQQLVSNTSSGISTAVSLIGQNVTATSNTANLTNGQAQWTYNLPVAASDLKVTVLDSSGNIMDAVAPSDLTAGNKAFTWNGKNLAGTQMPNGGTYTLQVTATDSTGTAIATTNYVQGAVTGVTQSNGSTFLTVNGSSVPWTAVTSVTAGGSTTSGAASAPASAISNAITNAVTNAVNSVTTPATS